MSAKATRSETARAYLLRGDDEMRKQESLQELLAGLVAGGFADFDLEQLHGDKTTSDHVMAGLHVPPFGSERRVVLVRYANKMDPFEQEKLASRLASAPASGCLILVNPAVEKIDGKVRKGSEVIGELSRAVRKVGEVRDFGRMRADAATTFARSVFQAAGKKISPPAVAALVQRVGTDSLVIKSEAQKLVDYSGNAPEITVRDVAAVTAETPEEKVFKLTDAIAARNQAEALRLLGELFEAGDDPKGDAPRTLSMIARQFRLIWQMKALQEHGVRSLRKEDAPEGVRSILPTSPNLLELMGRQAWLGKRLAAQARPFTAASLARVFQAIAAADRKLKGVEAGADDARLIMDLLVVELSRGPG